LIEGFFHQINRDFCLRSPVSGLSSWQEEHPQSIIARLRQVGYFIGQQVVRELGQNPGAVAGLAVSINTAAMFHAADGLQSHLDNIVTGPAGGAGDKTYPAGIMFKLLTI
jgi:hypothetical protein